MNVRDTHMEPKLVDDSSIINEYLHVFSEKLPELPPEREIEFEIEVYLNTNLILIPPYKMVSLELA